MQDVRENKKRSWVVFVGFLLILGIVVWYIGRFWYEGKEEKAGQTALESEKAAEVALTDLRFLNPKEILARLERSENIRFVDIRTREDFDVEHIVDSISAPVTTLNTFTPNPGELIIVVSGPEVPNETLKGIYGLFTERKYTFAFLEGSIVDWRLAGGTTISTGDPTSIFDYSKIIFINPEQVSATASELSNPFFLDVREPNLFKTEHIPGAINIPLAELEKRRSEIPRGKSIFVYGANDYEGYQGGVKLFDLDFFGSRVIRGGLSVWKEKQLPITTDGQ